MDREIIIQVVALLVVAMACLRWLPDEDPLDPIGLGVPWETLRVEQQLLEFGPSSDDAMTFLNTIRKAPERQGPFRRHWRALMQQLRAIEADPEYQPDTLVQFRGIPRNDMWPLMYLLYPQPTTFVSFEAGSRPNDELIPGAMTIDSSLMPWDEMTDEQRAHLRARQGR